MKRFDVEYDLRMAPFVHATKIELIENKQIYPFNIYDLLNITFVVDEELKSWLEIHDWIRAMTFPKEFAEYRNLSKLNKYATNIPIAKPQYSDATVTLLSSSNTPYYNIKFFDVFPTTLSTFIMSATDSPDTIITADATFRYSYFDIEKLF